MRRLLFAAPRSGEGKTTVVCGVLKALADRRFNPIAYKSGPDYIDPMFHRQILGRPSHNLDLFLMGKEAVLALLSQGSEDDIGILEGAMGYYDGIAMGDSASAYQLAQVTKTPVVLVIDGRGQGLSIVPTIKGFLEFRQESMIKGVILNQISPMIYPVLKNIIEDELGITVYGYLPKLSECAIESRHLGLVTPLELEDLQKKLTILGENVEKTVDLDGLLYLAETASGLDAINRGDDSGEERPKKATIAVAKDRAFCFYYASALSALERAGAELVYFSPMDGEKLPACDGLYLGGGYPELHAKTLSDNHKMRESVKTAIENGLPTVAECGGFLYLHRTLEGADGACYPMADVFAHHGFATKKLSRFGYLELEIQKNGLLGQSGTRIPAHEFHYWDSSDSGRDFHGQKPQSMRNWHCGHHSETLYAGFPHFHFGGDNALAEGFVTACVLFRKNREMG